MLECLGLRLQSHSLHLIGRLLAHKYEFGVTRHLIELLHALSGHYVESSASFALRLLVSSQVDGIKNRLLC